MEFHDIEAANAVLKQHDWELDGRALRVDRAGGGGGGGSGGRGDAGGGQSKFHRTYHH